MKSVYFDKANIHLDPPNVLLEEGHRGVYASRSNDGVIISKWRPSFIERFKILLFGSLWLRVYGGETQPPISMSIAGVFPRAYKKKFSVSVPIPNRRRRKELVRLNRNILKKI